MNRDGLLVIPQFENTQKYLKAGKMTQLTSEIIKASEQAVSNLPKSKANGKIVKELLVWMHKNTKILSNYSDERKFKRTACEILQSKERTGCCDSSTLFVALARAQNIPSMQVITLNKEEGRRCEQTGRPINSGHFFTACYLTDINGESKWNLIDTNRTVSNINEVRFLKWNLEDRNIAERFLAFAYVNDFEEVEIDGLKIDSIKNMGIIQKIAYEQANKSRMQFLDER